jgi:uncharacterized RDD family membrane protein YckC
MANAAPYIASPMRRLLAGAVDLALIVVLVLVLLGVIVSSSDASGYIEVALLNRAAFVTYAGYHVLFFWFFHGQTPGLLVLNMRVVKSADVGELKFIHAMLRASLRPLVLYLIGWGAVMAQPIVGAIAAVVAAPLVVEPGMMFTLPTRQTLSDLVCRTFVVNIPPPQPHRAPAAPMYSATDAEFGVRPRRVR